MNEPSQLTLYLDTIGTLKKRNNSWSKQDLIRLLSLASNLNANEAANLMKIGQYSTEECYMQLKNLQKNWREGPWLQVEDVCLFFILRNQEIPDFDLASVTLRTRSPEECRLRWKELKENTQAAGGWGYQEQIILYKLTRKLNFKWKEIAMKMPLRTRNLVKGFFHATYRQIKKKTILFWNLENVLRWPTFIHKSKQFANGLIIRTIRKKRTK
jgi:hypothetical protein